MSLEFKRAQRVAQLIQEELGTLFIDGLRDPRIGFVTVTEVRVSDDLRNARVYVSVYGTDEARQASLEGIRDAAGYLKHEIGKRLKLRFTPHLSFAMDESLERAARVETLLTAVRRGEIETPSVDANDIAPVVTARSDLEASRKLLDDAAPPPPRPVRGRRKNKRKYS